MCFACAAIRKADFACLGLEVTSAQVATSETAVTAGATWLSSTRADREQFASQYSNTLDSGYEWQTHTLTWSAPATSIDSGALTPVGEEHRFIAFSEDDKNQITSIFNYISSIVNLNFSQTSSENSDMKFGYENTTVAGYANYPNSDLVKIILDDDYVNKLNQPGSYALYVAIHEIGHALGLKHPHEDDPILLLDLDTSYASSMSYNDFSIRVNSNQDPTYIQSFMEIDIQYLISKYGKSNKISGEEFTFQFSESLNFSYSSNSSVVNILSMFYLHDEKSNVHLDFSALSNSMYHLTLDLSRGAVYFASGQGIQWRQEEFNGESVSEFIYSDQYSQIYNTKISSNTYIAKITGTNLADVITGNEANSVFRGGGGLDQIDGGGGSDTYIYTETEFVAEDVIADTGASGTDVVQITSKTDITDAMFANKSGLEAAILASAVSYTLGANAQTSGIRVVTMQDAGTLVASAYTAGLTVTAAVGANNVTIITGTGDDSFTLGAGNDVLDGGSGIDTAIYEGTYSSYQISGSAEGTLLVRSLVGSEDTDTLQSVERLQFAGRTLDVDDALAGKDLVYRFYNPGGGSHFYTANLAEKTTVQETIPSFTYEGPAFFGSLPGTGGDPVYRFYNTLTGTHFYTIFAEERDAVRANLPEYVYEGPAYNASATQVEGSQALYRFYNTERSVHFYTGNEAERDAVIATLPQFNYEGIGYWVFG